MCTEVEVEQVGEAKTEQLIDWASDSALIFTEPFHEVKDNQFLAKAMVDNIHGMRAFGKLSPFVPKNTKFEVEADTRFIVSYEEDAITPLNSLHLVGFSQAHECFR